MVAPVNPFACWSFQTPARGSPPYRSAEIDHNVSPMHTADLRGRPRARVARQHRPENDGDEHYDEDATEHVFAL